MASRLINKLFLLFHQIGYTLLSFWTSLITLPIVLILFVIGNMVRLVVATYLRYATKGRIHLMEPTDSMNNLEYERSPGNYILCFFVRQPITHQKLEEVRERLRRHLDSPPYNKLQYRICTKAGYSCWEDLSGRPEFDIKDHVKLCPGVESWEKSISETKLMQLVSKVLNSSLKQSGKPDWEILIAPRVRMNADNSDETPGEPMSTLIIRMQHSYMDGYCAIAFLQTCLFDVEGVTTTFIESVSKLPKEPWYSQRRLGLFAKVLLYGPFYMVTLFIGGIRRSNRVLHEITSDATFIGRSKLRMSPSTLNKIRIAFNCHTRSVIIYAFLSALHRLGERCEISAPPQVRMVFTHAMPPYPKNKLVNKVSLISKMLPLAGPNLLQQIDGITRVSEENAHEILAIHWGSKLVGLSPAVALNFIADNVVHPCGMTTASSSERCFRFFGGDVESVFGLPPMVNGSEYLCAFCTYGGNLSVAFRVGSTQLVQNQYDLQNFIVEFDNCLKELEIEARMKHANKNYTFIE
ncbi:unnamed protein product [Orchesella dallaii]|uniref:O-acyltransferase WSD1 C-terminal domain-containing protein n=1 Tax=Orchesella dallaii TaxID=48710 RepID=A0ABP1Q782_9HEXA